MSILVADPHNEQMIQTLGSMQSWACTWTASMASCGLPHGHNLTERKWSGLGLGAGLGRCRSLATAACVNCVPVFPNCTSKPSVLRFEAELWLRAVSYLQMAQGTLQCLFTY